MLTAAVMIPLLFVGATGAELQLDWQAPPECGSKSVVSAAVARALKRPLADGPTRVRARARVTKEPRGYVLKLKLRNRHGASDRELWSDSCSTVQEALAVILALSLDGTEKKRLRVPVVARPLPELSTTSTESVESRWRVDVLAALDLGLLPRAGMGFEGLLGYQQAAFRLSGGALLRLRRTQDFDSGRVSARVVAATAQVCWLPATPWLVLEGCVTAEAGQFAAQGSDFFANERVRSLWLAARVGGGPTFRLAGPVGARVLLEALVPIARPRLVVTDGANVARTAFQVPGVAANLSFGLFVDFL